MAAAARPSSRSRSWRTISARKECAPGLADDRAVRLHQAFKFAVIGGIQMDRWNLTTSQVEREIEKIEREDPSCA